MAYCPASPIIDSDPLGVLPDVETRHPRPTFVGHEQCGQDADECGLSRSVGAEQGEHSSGVDSEGHVIERQGRPEPLGHFLDFDGSAHHPVVGPMRSELSSSAHGLNGCTSRLRRDRVALSAILPPPAASG